MKIPLLYPIVDADRLSVLCGQGGALQSVCTYALALAAAGCTMLEYRASGLDVQEALTQGRELRRLLPETTLIMNGRADLSLAAGFDGVHVGQQGLSSVGVRRVMGAKSIVGLSVHSAEQAEEALKDPVDYLMIGPIFASGEKNLNPIGLPAIAAVRSLRDHSTREVPIVAAGGITRENVASVCRAGADSVAVFDDISRSPRDSAREFFRLMM